jgi:uncharacterized protein (TIGR00369 family)
MAMTDDEMRAMFKDPTGAPPSSRLLGFEMLDFSISPGWAEVAFTPTAQMANPMGVLQGGFVTAMLDDAMGVAASIHGRFAVVVPTLQITTTFIRATPLSRVLARGEVVRMGQTTCLLQGTLRLPDGTILATATASAAVRPYPAEKRTRSA